MLYSEKGRSRAPSQSKPLLPSFLRIDMMSAVSSAQAPHLGEGPLYSSPGPTNLPTQKKELRLHKKRKMRTSHSFQAHAFAWSRRLPLKSFHSLLSSALLHSLWLDPGADSLHSLLFSSAFVLLQIAARVFHSGQSNRKQSSKRLFISRISKQLPTSPSDGPSFSASSYLEWLPKIEVNIAFFRPPGLTCCDRVE